MSRGPERTSCPSPSATSGWGILSASSPRIKASIHARCPTSSPILGRSPLPPPTHTHTSWLQPASSWQLLRPLQPSQTSSSGLRSPLGRGAEAGTVVGRDSTATFRLFGTWLGTGLHTSSPKDSPGGSLAWATAQVADMSVSRGRPATGLLAEVWGTPCRCSEEQGIRGCWGRSLGSWPTWPHSYLAGTKAPLDHPFLKQQFLCWPWEISTAGNGSHLSPLLRKNAEGDHIPAPAGHCHISGALASPSYPCLGLPVSYLPHLFKKDITGPALCPIPSFVPKVG